MDSKNIFIVGVGLSMYHALKQKGIASIKSLLITLLLLFFSVWNQLKAGWFAYCNIPNH